MVTIEYGGVSMHSYHMERSLWYFMNPKKKKKKIKTFTCSSEWGEGHSVLCDVNK